MNARSHRSSGLLMLVAVALAAALVGLVPFTAIPSTADTCKTTTWQGTVSDEWTDPDNWDQGAPLPCWSAVLDGGSTTHPHIIDAPSIGLNSLTLENGVSVAGDANDTVITANIVNWSNGTSFLGIVAQASLNITGTDSHVLHNGTDNNTETLTNDGLAVMGDGSTLSLESGAKVLNNSQWTTPAATATVSGDVCCATLNTFENHGTVDASGGGLIISNMGYIGSSTGVVQGDVNLDAGSHTLLDGTKVKGSGSVLHLSNNATVAVSGTIHLDNQGRISQESGARVTGTAVTFKGNGIGGDGTYDWSSGTTSASPTFLQGADLLVEGIATKTLDGTTGSKHGVLTIDLGANATEEGTGTLTLSKAAIHNNGVWKVPSGQVVHMAGVACCAARPFFRNEHTLQIASSSTLDFTNAHFVAGTSGTVTGGTLDLGSGLHPFDDGTKLRNGVTVEVDRSGTLGGSGLISLGQASSLVQGGGATITGQHDIEGSGSYTWGSGTISGQLTVGPGVATHVSDLAADSSHTRSLTTVGTKAASLLVGGGATQGSSTPITMGAATEITNGHGSTWTITKGGFSGGVCCAFPALVINQGTFAVNPGTGKSGSFAFLSFRNRGSLRVLTGTAAFSGVDPAQFDGATSVKGTLSTSGSYDVEGGKLSGPGKVSGNLIDNGGSVSPGTLIGTLHITGNFTQGSGGTLVADLKNAANDLLVVGGTAQLNGTLKLKLDQSGNLTRTARTLVQANSVTGPSATTGLSTLGGKWAVHTTSTQVRLVPV